MRGVDRRQRLVWGHVHAGSAMRIALRRRSCSQAGRLVPLSARWLRARVVSLRRGRVVDWHSTDDREELLLALGGRVEVHVQSQHHRASPHRITLSTGQSLFLPRQTIHRVVNRRSAQARYAYVTAPR